MKLTNVWLGTLALGLLAGCSSTGSAGARGPTNAGARSPNEGTTAAAGAAATGEESAERCLLRGRADFAAKRYADAEGRLELAWDGDARAEIAADLGRVELELGKLGEAAAHLSAALDGGIGAVEAQLGQIRPKLGAVALKPPAAGVEVSVFVDGWRATHRLPRAELWLSPGKHEVELRAGARIVAKKTFDIQLGQRVDWDASIDGKFDGEVPFNGKVDVNAKLPNASGGLSTPLLVVGGIVGALAIGIGTGLAVAASNLGTDLGKIEANLKAANPDIEFPCQGANRAGHEPQCALLEAKLADQDLFLKVGIPVLVGAGLVVAGGLTYILWPRAKVPDAKVEICGVTVRPAIGPGSFALQGTF